MTALTPRPAPLIEILQRIIDGIPGILARHASASARHAAAKPMPIDRGD